MLTYDLRITARSESQGGAAIVMLRHYYSVQLLEVHIKLKYILIMCKHLIYKSFNLVKYQTKKIMRILSLLFGIIDEFVKYLR